MNASWTSHFGAFQRPNLGRTGKTARVRCGWIPSQVLIVPQDHVMAMTDVDEAVVYLFNTKRSYRFHTATAVMSHFQPVRLCGSWALGRKQLSNVWVVCVIKCQNMMLLQSLAGCTLYINRVLRRISATTKSVSSLSTNLRPCLLYRFCDTRSAIRHSFQLSTYVICVFQVPQPPKLFSPNFGNACFMKSWLHRCSNLLDPCSSWSPRYTESHEIRPWCKRWIFLGKTQNNTVA